MRINTGEITEQQFTQFNMKHAGKVEMDEMQVMTFDKKSDINKTLLYTEGVGPCISIIMCGEVHKTGSAAPETQKFVAMYHWSGGTVKQLDKLQALTSQQRGITLAEICFADMVDGIKTVLCDVSMEEFANYKVTIKDIALVGGERQQEHLSGAEMQVQGLRDFLRRLPFRNAFREKYGVSLPEMISTNAHTFLASGDKYLDVFVGLDERGHLQVDYLMCDSSILQLSNEEPKTDYDSDINEEDNAVPMHDTQGSIKPWFSRK